MHGWVSVVTAIVAVAALMVSITTAVYTRKRERRQLFLQMHERLIDTDQLLGRRTLFRDITSVEDVGRLERQQPEIYLQVHRTLAMLDILGCYAMRGYVDKQVILEEWGHWYAKAYEHGRYVIEYRVSVEPTEWLPWPNLRRFGLEEAVPWSRAHKANDPRWSRSDGLDQVAPPADREVLSARRLRWLETRRKRWRPRALQRRSNDRVTRALERR
jgi:hypothetical protein